MKPFCSCQPEPAEMEDSLQILYNCIYFLFLQAVLSSVHDLTKLWKSRILNSSKCTFQEEMCIRDRYHFRQNKYQGGHAEEHNDQINQSLSYKFQTFHIPPRFSYFRRAPFTAPFPFPTEDRYFRQRCRSTLSRVRQPFTTISAFGSSISKKESPGGAFCSIGIIAFTLSCNTVFPICLLYTSRCV